MPLFYRKPVFFEAEQWFPGVEHPGVRMECDVMVMSGGKVLRHRPLPYVTNINGTHVYLVPGDWIIPESKAGRYWTCGDAEFRKTFVRFD